jgi:hypothetical protein
MAAAKEIAANLAAPIYGVKSVRQNQSTPRAGIENVTVDLDLNSSQDAPNDSPAGRRIQVLNVRQAE